MEITEKAFLAGRSKQTWESFRLENKAEFTEIDYWKNRCKKAENLCRVLIRVNPMVKDLKPVKEAKEEWTPYCNLHDQLKVWNDHE